MPWSISHTCCAIVLTIIFALVCSRLTFRYCYLCIFSTMPKVHYSCWPIFQSNYWTPALITRSLPIVLHTLRCSSLLIDFIWSWRICSYSWLRFRALGGSSAWRHCCFRTTLPSCVTLSTKLLLFHSEKMILPIISSSALSVPRSSSFQLKSTRAGVTLSWPAWPGRPWVRRW